MSASHLELTVGDLVFDAVAWGPTDGEPVLLLHGFPECAWAWRFVQPALADAGYRSVAPDLRGYSPRARPLVPEAYAIDTLVDDALGLADSLGWDRFHVMGHDWGGVVAWHTAGRAAERVRTLTAVSTPHPKAFADAKAGSGLEAGDDQAAKASHMDVFRTPGSEELFLADGGAGFRAGLEAAGLDPDSATHHVARATASTEAMVGMLNWYRGATPEDADAVGPITVPTLYLWPDADAVFGPTAAHATAGHVEGPYRFEVLEGTSHWVPEDDHEALVGLLIEHLVDAGT